MSESYHRQTGYYPLLLYGLYVLIMLEQHQRTAVSHQRSHGSDISPCRNGLCSKSMTQIVRPYPSGDTGSLHGIFPRRLYPFQGLPFSMNQGSGPHFAVFLLPLREEAFVWAVDRVDDS